MTAVSLSHPVTVPSGIAKILGLLVRNCLCRSRFCCLIEEGRRRITLYVSARRFYVGAPQPHVPVDVSVYVTYLLRIREDARRA